MDTLLRDEEGSEVQLFLFPNPTPRSPPPPPFPASPAAPAPTTSLSGPLPTPGTFSKVAHLADTKGARKGPRGLPSGVLQQDVAGVLRLHSEAAQGAAEEGRGGGGRGGKGWGGEEDAS